MENYTSLLSKETPQRSAAKSSYIQKCISFGSTKKGLSFEDSNNDLAAKEHSMSILSQGNEYNSNISGIYEIDNSKLEASGMNMYRDPSCLDSNFTNRFDRSVPIKEDNTNTSKVEFTDTVYLDIDPESYFSDTLSEEFLEFFLSYAGEHEIFDLLMNYENICCKGIENLSKQYPKRAVTEKLPSITAMLSVLQLERNTWRLLRILFQDRVQNEIVDESEQMLALSRPPSYKQTVDNFYQRDAYVRQSQLIVDWLENNTDEDFQHTQFDKLEYFTDQCFSLEHSMNELLTSDYNPSIQNKIKVEMDPDAGFRQGNFRLHEADKENENRLFKFMFICIRAGKLDAAQELAEKFGEPCIAAALEGWRLHHDPNLETQVMDGEELLPVEGNKYRDLWKSACWTASQEPCVSKYEQAVYGSLCGNLKAVLPVCSTWEDFLWAYIKTSLDKLIEHEIRNSLHLDRNLEDLPAEYWDKIYDIEDIFHELEAMNLNQGSKNAYHIIQKYIILDDLGGLIEEMYSWLNSRKLDAHVLRLMTHIILFFRVVGRSTKEELCIPVLEAYVQELIHSQKKALVASYTSTLPKEQQIMWYAKFLEGISDNDERQKWLQYAEDAGLDVPHITTKVVKNICENNVTRVGVDTELMSITTEEDLQKIHAIDWLIFNPNQRAEAVKQANTLLRLFIAQKKLEAAKLLFSKIPADSIAIMMHLSKAENSEELSPEDDNATREYLCFKTYLEAMDAFNAWFHHSIHARPKEPSGPSGDHVTFKEKVAHEHEIQQYRKDLKRWEEVVNMMGSTASEYLYNVLLFVDGGWMVDQRLDGKSDENRKHQMAHLRKFCIPHVTNLLQELFRAQEKHKELIRLADILATERYQLYKEFNQEELKQILKMSLKSSFAVLDSNLDPLGYPI